jgi:hypothetical protein
MSDCLGVLGFLYGTGFWYGDPLREVKGLTEEQLFWTPDPGSLCALWQVGHIAHRERLHVARFLQGLSGPIMPTRFEVFGPEWRSTEEIRAAVPSIQEVFGWVQEVRRDSLHYIESLSEADLGTVPPTSEGGLTVGHWLFITTVHAGLHIGKIQLLRALIEGTKDRPC